jgi:PAS domain S-box-containing protein
MTDTHLSGEPSRSGGDRRGHRPPMNRTVSLDVHQAESARSTLVRYSMQVLVLAVVYLSAAKLGLAVPVAHGNATPIWAPTGISLAALLLYGYRLWPGVALGALVANATTDISLAAAAGIGTGNTLEALAGAYVLHRVAFRYSLDRVRDVLALTVLAALFSTAISATVGVTSLRVAGEIASAAYPSSWAIWWFGDAMGNLLVAPLLLVWIGHPPTRIDLRRILEGSILLILLVTVSFVVFFWTRWSFAYAILFPLLIWGALRFRQRGVTTGTLVVATIAVWATLTGSVPFAEANLTQNVAILQAQISVIAVALLIVAATMSERERAENALRDSEERFRRVFENGPLGMALVDRDFRFIRANKAFSRMLGYTERELEALAFVDITHPDDVDLDVDLARRVLEGTIPSYQIEKRYITKNGRSLPVSLTATVVRDQHGKPLYGLGIIEDVTERRRAEDALRTGLEREKLAAERLRQLDQLKNEFVAMIAHDLRSPLGVIGNLAYLLREKWDVVEEGERREFLDRISHRTTELSKLVVNVLDLAAIESGELRYDIQPFDLGALAAKIVEELEMAHPERAFRVHLPESLPLASGDRNRNWQILSNLLGNAIKFSSENYPIDVSVSSGETFIQVDVRDEGIGIASEDEPKLFQRFSRLNQDGGGGTGLGLYMCKSMVEAQGGRIWVESHPGKGSTFRYTLPIAQP